MAFRGTYDHTLDAKNRLTVPAKFRPQLAGGIVVAAGLERCAEVWTPDAFDAHVAASLQGMHPASPEARRLSLFYTANAFDAELDAAGRVMVPGALLTYAGLEKDVVVTGGGDHLKLWDREAWAAMSRELAAQAVQVTDQLSRLPIA